MVNKKIGFVLICVALLAVVAIFYVANRPDIVNTKIVLSGPTGIEVTGTYTADGKEYDVQETLPAELTIDARRLSLLLESSSETGAILAEVAVSSRQGSAKCGFHQGILIEVTGNTMFSSTPRTRLEAKRGL